jgi:hypothetical protein
MVPEKKIVCAAAEDQLAAMSRVDEAVDEGAPPLKACLVAVPPFTSETFPKS